MSLLRRFVKDTSGVSAVDYALLIGGNSLAIITILQTVGANVFWFYSKIQSGMTAPN